MLRWPSEGLNQNWEKLAKAVAHMTVVLHSCPLQCQGTICSSGRLVEADLCIPGFQSTGSRPTCECAVRVPHQEADAAGLHGLHSPADTPQKVSDFANQQPVVRYHPHSPLLPPLSCPCAASFFCPVVKQHEILTCFLSVEGLSCGSLEIGREVHRILVFTDMVLTCSGLKTEENTCQMAISGVSKSC